MQLVKIKCKMRVFSKSVFVKELSIIVMQLFYNVNTNSSSQRKINTYRQEVFKYRVTMTI